VAATERCAVCHRRARADVQYQRILCSGDIRAGQECGCPPTGQCQAGSGGNNAPRPLGCLRRQCLAEKIRTAVFEFTQPDCIGIGGRRRAAQHGVTRDACLGQCNGAVAVEHAIKSFLADVRTCGRTEYLAVPADSDIT